MGAMYQHLIRRALARRRPSVPPVSTARIAPSPATNYHRHAGFVRRGVSRFPPAFFLTWDMELEEATRRFHLWFRGLRSLRRDLQSARWSDDPAQITALVAGFVAHFSDYCAARAELDPVWTLSAPWASPVERGAAYWLAGWRPTMLVHLLYTESGRRFEAQLPDLLLGVQSGNLGDLSPGQLAQIDELQRRTVAEEDGLSREMAQVQEGHGAVAAGGELDVDGLVGRVRGVLGKADGLRLSTMKRAVEILEPAQAAELLVAAADMEIGFREFGIKYGGGGSGRGGR